jgi:hypothetical protein
VVDTALVEVSNGKSFIVGLSSAEGAWRGVRACVRVGMLGTNDENDLRFTYAHGLVCEHRTCCVTVA